MSAVLLVIDMQVDFFRHERLSKRQPELVSQVNSLVSTMRSAGVPVIWVRQEFAPDLGDASLEVKRTSARVVIAGTPGASLLPGLEVDPDDHFVIKKRYSAFFGTGLDSTLQSMMCTTVIVAGVNTHACIRTTVVDAYQRDYDVILARDCIDSLDLEHHDVSWRYMDGKLGRGMSNDEIGAVFKKTGSEYLL